jgi:hypothetical protein
LKGWDYRVKKMAVCNICKQEIKIAHSKRVDLCVSCGIQADKFMLAAYVITKGKQGVIAPLEEIKEFCRTYSHDELKAMATEVKRIKYFKN